MKHKKHVGLGIRTGVGEKVTVPILTQAAKTYYRSTSRNEGEKIYRHTNRNYSRCKN